MSIFMKRIIYENGAEIKKKLHNTIKGHVIYKQRFFFRLTVGLCVVSLTRLFGARFIRE